MTEHQKTIAKYLKAIRILESMGLRQTSFANKSQLTLGGILDGKEGLAAFEIDPVTKAVLSTDQNWALASSILSQCEEALADELISPGRDWILELEERAYGIGTEFGVSSARTLGRRIRVGLTGIDATTLRMIKERGFEKITGLADKQIEYLRHKLMGAVIENRTWTEVQKDIIRDGKIPALVDSKGRLIEMETRVENIVRTEVSQISEQGTRDKAREIYGTEQLAMKWHAILDGRERKSHRARHGEVKLVTKWETVPHPSDGKTLMPGQDFNCRCWGEYGTLEELKKAA